ncbi:conjugal transfer protein [Desulfofundulus thermocisternus]|uniref:conjugal transfer protein n=1 Tax=Desulfofundulus thermocisternus TaxID=42471 RepID=UPI00217CFCA7|nr:conjugal transfer protein [Desulfofundulus thermocisternus]MCS5697262.1 conjugal transfer protein [Desulfofundulus thermocisternus]
MNRKLFYRWVAAGLLWFLIFAVVVISIRNLNVVTRVSRIAADAMTVTQQKTISGVRDIARAFAVEWATWNGNPDDYNRRLGVFLKDTTAVHPPDAVQEVTSSTVSSADAVSKTNYRVRVLLHVRRLVPVSSSSNIPAVLIPVTVADLEHLRVNAGDTGQQKRQAWQDVLMCVEVPVQVIDGTPAVSGLPVIVAPAETKGDMTSHNFNVPAPPDFKTFIDQFMNMYYSGQPLTNFITPGVKIDPVTGWKLVSVDSVLVNSDRDPTAARVQVTVSAPGVDRLAQTVYLKVRADRGSYLVESLGAGY